MRPSLLLKAGAKTGGASVRPVCGLLAGAFAVKHAWQQQRLLRCSLISPLQCHVEQADSQGSNKAKLAYTQAEVQLSLS